MDTPTRGIRSNRSDGESDHLSFAGEEPIPSPDQWKQSRRIAFRSRVRKVLINPLTLVLLTWFIMAVLLWLEVVGVTK